MKIVVIMPVYNEMKRALRTLGEVLEETKSDVVVIDDGSNDETYKLLVSKFGKNKRVVLLQHVINLGKGAAMKTGVKVAFKMGATAVIFIDADGQHNPKHLKNFEKELEKKKIVFGYRMMGQEMPAIRKWGNIFSIKLIKIMFNIRRSDLLCGYFGFRKSIYKKIKWKSNRYGVETEIATMVGRNRIDFSELKVDTIYIDKYKGVSIFDALKILPKLPHWYFRK